MIFSESYFKSSYDEYPNIQPTAECAWEIAAEGYCDINKLLSAVYIADVKLEEAVREGANATVLMEGALEDFKRKTIATLKKIKDTVIGWFKKAIEHIKITLTKSKDFATKWKSELTERIKHVSDYEPKVYDVKVEPAKVGEHISKYMVNIVDAAKNYEMKKDMDNGSFIEDIVKDASNNNASNMGEFKKTVYEEIISTDKSSKRISASDVNTYIARCEASSSAINTLDHLRKINIGTIEKAISDIDNSSELDYVHAATKAYNSAISLIQQLNGVGLNALKAIQKDAVSVLKGLMYRSPKKKESTNESYGSIFESAMSMI